MEGEALEPEDVRFPSVGKCQGRKIGMCWWVGGGGGTRKTFISLHQARSHIHTIGGAVIREMALMGTREGEITFHELPTRGHCTL